ncbi:YCF48-related protein [Calditrichota bacterium]
MYKLSSLAVYVLAFTLFSDSLRAEPFWQFHNPRPSAGTITSVDFVDEDQGWLITEAGYLMQTTDGGINWSMVDFPLSSRGPWKLDFYTEYDGWIIGGADIESPWLANVYITDDGGDNWEVVSLGSGQQPASFTCLQSGPAGSGWIGGGSVTEGAFVPAVFRLSAQGSWLTSTLPSNNSAPAQDIFRIEDIGFAIGENGYVAKTTNGGLNWQRLDAGIEENLFSVHFTNPLIGWVGGGSYDDGVIYRTINSGVSWSQSDYIADNTVVDIQISSGNTTYAAVQRDDTNSRVIVSTNNEDWDVDYSTNQFDITSIFASPGIQVLTGSEGLVAVKNHDDWTAHSRQQLRGNVNDIHFFSNEHGFVAGANGQLRYTSNNNTWRTVPADFEGDILAIWFEDRNVGWLCGEGSTELRTDNGGSNWEEVDISDYDVLDLLVTDGTFYARTPRSICVSENGGDDWIEYDFYPQGRGEVKSLSVANSSTAFFATGDSLMRTTDSGENWENIRDRASGVYFVSENRGWVYHVTQGTLTRIYLTNNQGDDWTQVASIEDFTALGIDFLDNNKGYLWSNEGVILVTDDGGSSWEEANFRFKGRINSLFAWDDENIWVCGEFGMLAYFGDNLQLGIENPPVEFLPVTSLICAAYPNPTNGKVSVRFEADISGVMEMLICDFQGRILTMKRLAVYPGINLSSFDLNSFPTGTYLIRLTNNQGQTAVPFQLIK